MLSVEGVSKTFTGPAGRVVALEEVSAQLPAGQIIGLLGPNGSGKTTLLRILVGLLSPDTGKVLYQGQSLSPQLAREIGYMPEERGLYPNIRAQEQLLYLLRLKGLSRAEAKQAIAYWAQRLDMPWLDRRAKTLSKGMQQKVQLTLALAGQPKVLLLDEPFSGLDPIVATEIENLLRELAQTGTSILLSTHRLEQVDHLCQYVLMIYKGRLHLEGSVETLRRKFAEPVYELEINRPISEVPWPSGAVVHPLGSHKVEVRLPEGLSGRTLLSALPPETEVLLFRQRLPTIKDIFLKKVSPNGL